MTPATYRLVPTKPQFHDAIWSTTRFDFSRQKGNYVTKEVCLPLYNQNKKTLLKKKKKKRKTGFTQWRALFVVFCFTVARRLAIAMLLTLVPTGTPQGNAKKGKFEKVEFEYLHFLLLYTSTTPYFGSKHCIFTLLVACSIGAKVTDFLMNSFDQISDKSADYRIQYSTCKYIWNVV